MSVHFVQSVQSWLVVPTPLKKYEFVIIPIYEMEIIKAMFQTTNQSLAGLVYHLSSLTCC